MQTLNTTLGNLPKDRNGKISKDYLQVTLDVVSPSAGLPPVGAIEEVCYCCQCILVKIFIHMTIYNVCDGNLYQFVSILGRIQRIPSQCLIKFCPKLRLVVVQMNIFCPNKYCN